MKEMRAHDHHDPLTCSDLKLDQERVANECEAATCDLLRELTHYFGSVQTKSALKEGLYEEVTALLRSFAQMIADEISRAYATEALARTREATANMFEALAAGASFAHKTTRQGEDTGAAVHGLATIAASLGRPAVLDIEDKQSLDPSPNP